MKAEQILSTHPAYSVNAKLADYHYRSYVGSHLYKKGEYLTHYLGEELTPGDAYMKRINSTPLDNHVKTTIDIYGSFIFRNSPNRTLGTALSNPSVIEFTKDIDNNGQSIDSFMKTVNDYAMVQGSMWILIDKPSYAVETVAQEQALGIRPYACAYNPQNVLDWQYQKQLNGKNELVYCKVVESDGPTDMMITEWYPDHIHRYVVEKDDLGNASDIKEEYTYVNPLGMIPIIHYAPIHAPTKGIGYSLVGDVADAQKYIYNLLSELEQTVRISGHPSLVKTPSTTATAGAGAIITVQEDTDPGLKPYLLSPSGSSIEGILDAIDKTVHAIHRMTHTSAVQIMRGSPMSGVALQTERSLLNTRLSDISHLLQETEYKMWKLFAMWQNITMPADFAIEYPESFDIRDEHSDLELYRKAIESVPHEAFQMQMHKQIADMLIKDEETRNEVFASIEQDHMQEDVDIQTDLTQ